MKLNVKQLKQIVESVVNENTGYVGHKHVDKYIEDYVTAIAEHIVDSTEEDDDVPNAELSDVKAEVSSAVRAVCSRFMLFHMR